MSEERDDSQKTEEPTQKRIDDAIKKGKVAFSREVNSFILLLLFTIFVLWFSPSLFKEAVKDFLPYIEAPHLIEIEGTDIVIIAKRFVRELLLLATLPLIISLVGSILGNFLQNGVITSPEAMKPDLSKISIISGFKRLFSMKSTVEFLKGIIKVILIGTAAYLTIRPDLSLLTGLHDYSFAGILSILLKLTGEMLITVCIVMAFIAGADLLYQKHEYIKSLRMTKHEVREELKQSEGDPEIKAKLKAIRTERARQRMMASVPEADVVITNPTHFSIALKYEAEEMEAPIVVAKGKDNIALKIREIARKNRIPIVENPPLARALFAVELDEIIPYEHYKAVAEVISYVMQLKGKKA